MRVKVDCLHACLRAGVGSLKLTLVEYFHSQPHSFHLWPMTTACCRLLLSAVHNVVSASPQQLLPCSFICFTPLDTHSLSLCLSFYSSDPSDSCCVPFHLRLCSLCFCLFLSTPLLHPSSYLPLSLPLNTQHHNNVKAAGCQL